MKSLKERRIEHLLNRFLAMREKEYLSCVHAYHDITGQVLIMTDEQILRDFRKAKGSKDMTHIRAKISRWLIKHVVRALIFFTHKDIRFAGVTKSADGQWLALAFERVQGGKHDTKRL